MFNYGIFVSEVNFIIELSSDVGSSLSVLSVVLLSEKTIVALVFRIVARRLLCNFLGAINSPLFSTGVFMRRKDIKWKFVIDFHRDVFSAE